jgi:hypothetical protein
MFQWGTFGANEIRAWATAHDTAYIFRSIPSQPQVGIDAGVASGDHGDSKSALGTFNPLFPTGIYFGQGALALNGPTNLIEVGPHLSLQFAKSLTVVMDDHAFWRTSLQDGVYGLGINLLIAGRGNSERYIGNQPTVGVYWNATRHLSVSTAYGHFFVGSFLAQASPPGKDVNYAGVWTTYKFEGFDFSNGEASPQTRIWRPAMTLKIQRIREKHGTRICVSGELRCSHLLDLRAEIEQVAQPITLDMDEVDVVDIDGIRLLNECQTQGIQVVNCSPYIREWMLQEKRTGEDEE